KSLDEIKNQIESEDKDVGGYLNQSLDTFYGQTLSPKMKSSEYLKSSTGWVYGCVGVIADEVASINLHLKRIVAGEEVELDEHQALDVIYTPNNAMSKFDFINLTFQYLELTGEAPWFVSFKNGKPVNLIL